MLVCSATFSRFETVRKYGVRIQSSATARDADAGPTTRRRTDGRRAAHATLGAVPSRQRGARARAPRVASRAIELRLTRPRCITRIRSLMPSSSGSSEEIMMIAGAARGEAVHQVVDLHLGADVDAARRLVEDEDPHAAGEPLAEDDLLLIAAAQQAHGLRRRRLHAQFVDNRLRQIGLAAARQHAESRQPTAVRQRDVSRDGQASDQACGLAIFWQQADAAGDRVGRATKSDGRAIDAMRPSSKPSAPEITRASSVRPAPRSPAMPRAIR